MVGRKAPSRTEEEQLPRGFDDFDLRLGDVLRGERATLGKSLLDVQRELKIKASYIAAIEAADASAFDTPGFIAGYVRSYARYLDMDPDWTFARFCEEADFSGVHGMSSAANATRATVPQRPVKPATEKPAAAGPQSDPLLNPRAPFSPASAGGSRSFGTIEPGAIGSVLVLVALIGGLAYGGWTVLKEVQRVTVVPVNQTPDVVADLDPLAGLTAGEDLEEIAADSGGPRAEALDRLYRPKALDVPVLVARDGPISALNPDEVGVLASARPPVGMGPGAPDGGPLTAATTTVSLSDSVSAAIAAAMGETVLTPGTDMSAEGDTPVQTASAAEADEVQVVAGDAPEVVMFAVRPAWVRVTGADGTVIFEKILDTGERFSIPKTEEPPLLRAGNSGSVYFAVNGTTYGPAGPGTSVAKKVSLGAQALTRTYQTADLGSDPDLAKVIAVAEAQPAD